MRYGPGRQPKREMSAADLLAVLDLLDASHIDAWLDGGWAVDAVLETQRRPHDDLDLVVQLDDVARLLGSTAGLGYEHVHGEPPTSFELVDHDGRQLDVHPVVFSDAGDGVYVTESWEPWLYPARGFRGKGRILGRVVRCLTPDVQVLCHTGYAPHRQSYDDVQALCERFGLRVPAEYGAPREMYPIRSL